MLHGWIVLDKPHGLGSTQAVGAVKRILREAGCPKLKTGHGGTLDPLATGVLPIALGEATKLTGRMLEASKQYDFRIAFGSETDTLDLEGQVTQTSDVRPTRAEVEAVLPRFRGRIAQMPPAFSAVKLDGKRAYDRARAGEEVTMAPRPVEIFGLDPLPGPERPDDRLDEVTLSAHVSKGTYIRSLARDIALALGTVGHVTMLRRTRAGSFGLDRAISLDFLAERANARAFKDVILPLRTALVGIPALALTPEQARLVGHGQVLTGIAAPDGPALATLDDIPVALVDVHSGTVKVERGFNL